MDASTRDDRDWKPVLDSPPRPSTGPRLPDRPALARVNSWRRHVPAVAGLLCFLTGLLDIIDAVTPELHQRVHALSKVVPGTVSRAAVAATVVVGVSLLLVAKGLRRRKRRAYVVVCALLAVSIVFHIVKGLDVEEAIVSAIELAALLSFRAEFQAKGDPRTRWRALWTLLLLFAGSVAIGLLVLQVRAEALVAPYTGYDELRQVVYGLVGATGPIAYRHERAGDVVGAILLGLGLLTALLPIYLALRPAEPLAALAPEDEERMRVLLAKHGERDSLGYFALRRDKSIVWSPTRKAVIAYRVVSGVMLASGDPLGDPEAWPGAICRFLEIAEEHAWVPAVMGCGEQAGTVWARHGLSALELGDEAIVEVAEFSLEGRSMRNVRQMVHRVERLGYTYQVRRVRDIPAAEAAQLRDEAANWRGAQTERGFSMALGRFGDPSDGDCVVVLAYQQDAAGHRRLRAFLHFVPWGADGLSLDLMRRDRSADPGLNELLIVGALRAAPDLGVRRMSLNFAVFRAALERGERLGAGPVLRAWRALLVFVSRWFQIESLYRFNAKFRPAWQPRFVCYPAARDIPRIALAALEAEAFIVWPRVSLRRVIHRRRVLAAAG